VESSPSLLKRNLLFHFLIPSNSSPSFSCHIFSLSHLSFITISNSICHLDPTPFEGIHVFQSGMDFAKRKKGRDGGVVFEKISNSAEYKNDILTSKLKMSVSAATRVLTDQSH
jgi:hypothetical protein